MTPTPWRSRLECPNCKKIMMAQNGEEGKFKLTCENCWYEMESRFWDGLSPSASGGLNA